MIIRVVIGVIWACIVSAPVLAAPFSAEASTVLLADIEAMVGTQDSVQGTFKQRKIISQLPNPLLSSGEFRFDQQDGLEWLVIEPISSRLRFDQDGVRQEQGGKAVWQMSADRPMVVMIGQVLGAVMATNWDVIEQYFSVEGSLKNLQWVLMLTPREAALAKVVPHIALRGERQLNSMTIFEQGGDRTEIDFSFRQEQ